MIAQSSSILDFICPLKFGLWLFQGYICVCRSTLEVLSIIGTKLSFKTPSADNGFQVDHQSFRSWYHRYSIIDLISLVRTKVQCWVKHLQPSKNMMFVKVSLSARLICSSKIKQGSFTKTMSQKFSFIKFWPALFCCGIHQLSFFPMPSFQHKCKQVTVQ